MTTSIAAITAELTQRFRTGQPRLPLTMKDKAKLVKFFGTLTPAELDAWKTKVKPREPALTGTTQELETGLAKAIAIQRARTEKFNALPKAEREVIVAALPDITDVKGLGNVMRSTGKTSSSPRTKVKRPRSTQR
jgi:hypothetical protein